MGYHEIIAPFKKNVIYSRKSHTLGDEILSMLWVSHAESCNFNACLGFKTVTWSNDIIWAKSIGNVLQFFILL